MTQSATGKSITQLITTFLGLLGLLGLTVCQYEWHLFTSSSRTALFFGIGIAVLKTILIATIFMELKRESALIRLTALAAVFWICLFYGLSSLDLLFRGS